MDKELEKRAAMVTAAIEQLLPVVLPVRIENQGSV